MAESSPWRLEVNVSDDILNICKSAPTTIRSTSGLQGHGMSIDVDHGAAGTSPTGRSCRLNVIGVCHRINI